MLILNFFTVFLKKNSKIKYLLLTFLLLPITIYLVATNQNASTDRNIQLYFKQPTELTQQLFQNLQKSADYNFMLAQSEQQLTDAVINGTAESAYIFSEYFSNDLQQQKLSRNITTVTLKDNPYVSFTNLLVYGAVFECLAPYIAENALAKLQINTQQQQIAQLMQDNFTDNGIVDIVHLNSAAATQSANPALMALLYGIICIFLLAWSFVACLFTLNSSEDSLFLPIFGDFKLQALKSLPIYCLSTAAAIASLAILHTNFISLNLIPEIVKLLSYQLLLFLTNFVLSRLLSANIMVLAMPIAIIFTIVTHPILLDVTKFLPQLKPLLLPLPTYQYLQYNFATALIFTVILLCFSLWIAKHKTT